jgi:hypothetical protein
VIIEVVGDVVEADVDVVKAVGYIIDVVVDVVKQSVI